MATLELILVLGPPGCGKTTVAKEILADFQRNRKTIDRLNRDEIGGSIANIATLADLNLSKGRSVLADNTYPTCESRAAIIAAGKKWGAQITVYALQRTKEQCQFLAARRMFQKLGRLISTSEIKNLEGDDPGVFPPVVQSVYFKRYEAPTLDAGIDLIHEKHLSVMGTGGAAIISGSPIVLGTDYVNKALILDYDGTLRQTKSGEKYPRTPDDVEILPGRLKKLSEYREKGYMLLGASNQSGVSKGTLSNDDAIACFERTNKLLDIFIHYKFCPHVAGPPQCYCRKPMPGMGVELIETFKLDPSQCIMVGDMTTDMTFAARCGFKGVRANEFFNA